MTTDASRRAMTLVSQRRRRGREEQGCEDGECNDSQDLAGASSGDFPEHGGR
jgi:hypothetical protein